MSPRPYRRRTNEGGDETRARIVAAARALLAGEELSAFTVDAVAHRADVARMTVYYQFASKAGLLEALYDDVAERGELTRMPSVFAKPTALEALDAFIEIFATFWLSDRVLMRRLRGLGTLDPEIASGIRAREERRRMGLRTIVSRMTAESGHPSPDAADEAIDVLYALTSFEVADSLAEGGRGAAQVAAIVLGLAGRAVGIS